MALAAIGIYVRTLMPSTGFWDTGEAQTVPATLSIFHPTGFPTYTLVGWLWSQLPVGEVAWRMNLLSAVCMALASGVVVLIAGHLIAERHRLLRATAAGTAGGVFAFAAEPWENATRADVHALGVLFVAIVLWLCLVWGAAERSGGPHAGRWLVGAAFAFGLGIGAHPLVGLLAVAIGPWLFVVDRAFWRRYRLIGACAVVLLLGVAIYAYIPLRALADPEPPLFYARPDTWERLRYLVFAEQFRGLFDDFGTPLANLDRKWAEAERVLSAQFVLPAWLLAAVGAAVIASRRIGLFVVLALVVGVDVFYAMHFDDGDIDRYYMPSLVVVAPLVGVALAMLATASARAVAEVGRRVAIGRARSNLASSAAVLVLGLGALLPAASLVTGYTSHDQSQNREADLWVASVHEVLPPNAVVISWWSYSTPLWYHRWIESERPDVTIIDERNILDDGYRTMGAAIRSHLGRRPVYVVPPDWDYEEITERWETRTVRTYPGYTDLLRIEAPRR